MITKEILKQVRQIEIKTRGLVNQVFSGEYHSVFKGKGMEFSEVREYQYGDDIRNIDWNVSARLSNPFIKVFEEERELTVILAVDLSGSLSFGTVDKTKQRIAAEISSILAFSAMKNNDKVGLVLFTDTIEKFVPPRKGKSHVLRIIREVLSFEPKGRMTKLNAALEFMIGAIKKRSIIFLISDFIDDDYQKALRIIGRKHDFIGVTLRDPKEINLPDVGLVYFRDPETGEERQIDLSNKITRKYFEEAKRKIAGYKKSAFMSSKIDSIEINGGQSYIKPLVEFFKQRERRWR